MIKPHKVEIYSWLSVDFVKASQNPHVCGSSTERTPAGKWDEFSRVLSKHNGKSLSSGLHLQQLVPPWTSPSAFSNCLTTMTQWRRRGGLWRWFLWFLCSSFSILNCLFNARDRSGGNVFVLLIPLRNGKAGPWACLMMFVCFPPFCWQLFTSCSFFIVSFLRECWWSVFC